MVALVCVVTSGHSLVYELLVVQQVAQGGESAPPPVGARLPQLLEQLRHRPPAEGHRSPAVVVLAGVHPWTGRSLAYREITGLLRCGDLNGQVKSSEASFY